MDTTNYSGEVWKTIACAPDYEVSDIGRVRKSETGRFLIQTTTPSGYRQVRLCVNSVAKTHYVHRLVASTFLGPHPGQGTYHVAHGNGKKADNRLCNLRWATPAENSADRWEHGTMSVGERNHRAKITDAVRDAIKLSREPGKLLAERYGISQQRVTAIRGRMRAPNKRSRIEAIAAKAKTGG